MSASNSTSNSKNAKPGKPHPHFPLFAHANGSWAKKIRGKLHYFGPWSNPEEALTLYLKEKDRLHSGLTATANPNELTVFLLCAKFLTTKKIAKGVGELAASSLRDYEEICKILVQKFGAHRLVIDLRPEDFEKLRSELGQTWGAYRMAKTVNIIRMVFNYGYKNGLLARSMIFGEGFKRPPKRALRQAKTSGGVKMFTPKEIRDMLETAGQPLRSMILLGINCGFGNSDIGSLPMSALDLDGGWLDFPRPKTAVDRRCPLWAETVVALRDWLTVRPKPKLPEHEPLVFITSQGGSWRKESGDNPITKETRKLLDRLGIEGHRNFYSLRHTFQTIGDESRDFVAVSKVMGHALPGIANEYRERISDARLLAVVECVHNWLWARSAPEPSGVLPFRRQAGA